MRSHAWASATRALNAIDFTYARNGTARKMRMNEVTSERASERTKGQTNGRTYGFVAELSWCTMKLDTAIPRDTESLIKFATTCAASGAGSLYERRFA